MIDPSILAVEPLFEGLSADQLSRIAALAELKSYEPGQFLFHEGEPARSVQLIRYGLVALQLAVPARGSVLLQTLRPGEVLGLSWMQPEARWLFDARAQSLTRTVAIDAQGLRRLMDVDHTLGYLLMQRLAQAVGQRLQAARLQLLDLYHAPR